MNPRAPLHILCSSILFVLGTAGPARPQCVDYGSGIRWTGTVSGLGGYHKYSGHCVTLHGGLIYLAVVDGRFYILDRAGDVLGQCRLDPRGLDAWEAFPTGVSVAIADDGGTYAYVAMSELGLRVIDVSNPSAPTLLQTLETPGRAYDVAAAGTTVYVADGQSGLQVVDVANPRLPTLVANVETPGDARGLTLAGSSLYLADGEAGLQVLDIANPTLPRIVGSVDTPGIANDVAALGSYVFVASGGFNPVPPVPGDGPAEGFVVADVTNPASPEVLPASEAMENVHALGFALSGSRLYVAGWLGLTIFDVSSPSSPQFLGHRSSLAFGVVVADEIAYVALYAEPGVLDILDVSNPGSPPDVQPLGFEGPDNSCNAFAFAAPYVYVAETNRYTGYSGLRIYDRSTRRQVGSVTFPAGHGAEAVAVAGAHAYVSGHWAHFSVIDVSQPSVPVRVAGLDIGGGIISLVDSYAYLAGDSLRVIDISTPSRPRVLGTVDSLTRLADMAVSDTHLYALSTSGHLSVFDVSTPEAPRWLARVPLQGGPGTLAVSGHYLFVSDFDQDGLTTIDISEPSAPRIVAHTALLGGGKITLWGNYAYLQRGYEIAILDISQPLSPRGVGRVFDVGVSDSPASFATDGSHLYVGSLDYHKGGEVVALPLQCDLTTPVTDLDLDAEPRNDGVRLHWDAGGTTFATFDVFRAPGAPADPNAYVRLGAATRIPGSDSWEYLDSDAFPGDLYTYCIEAFQPDGQVVRFGPVLAVALPQHGPLLHAIAPSPLRDIGTITFSLPYHDTVRLEVYDARGRRIRELAHGVHDRGTYRLTWDGIDAIGRPVSSGIYFVRLSFSGGFRVARTVFIR